MQILALLFLGIMFVQDSKPSHHAFEFQTRSLGDRQEVATFPRDIEEGQAAVFIFWATWCGPCKIEMRRLQEAVQTGKIPGKYIYAVNIDEDFEKAQAYVLERELQFRFYWLDKSLSINSQVKIDETPQIFLYDRQQQLQKKIVGLKRDTIEQILRLFNSH